MFLRPSLAIFRNIVHHHNTTDSENGQQSFGALDCVRRRSRKGKWLHSANTAMTIENNEYVAGFVVLMMVAMKCTVFRVVPLC
jgi:hypothetical protein